MTRQYRILYGPYPSYRHLVSIEGGARTACGLVFKDPLVEMPGEVSCIRCGKTHQFRMAVATGQVVDSAS